MSLLDKDLNTRSATPASRSELADAVALLVDHLGARPLGLVSLGAADDDRSWLAAHLGRNALHGCPGRDFRAAWRTNAAGERIPRLFQVGSKGLGRCQYVALTHQHRRLNFIEAVDGRIANVPFRLLPQRALHATLTLFVVAGLKFLQITSDQVRM